MTKLKKLFLPVILFSFIIISSCHEAVKKDPDDKFERQNSEISTDEMLIGDDIDFWGVDTPRAGFFILRSKTEFLKGFAIKPLSFRENDKTQEQLSKQIETDPIYQLEVYEIEKTSKETATTPDICEYIQSNFYKAVPLVRIKSISFRLKERNWIPINAKVSSNALIFVRLGIADSFSVIKNGTSDSLIISAKRSDKEWSEFLPNDKKQIIAWSCQEANFMTGKSLEPVYYNPDIAFNFE